MKKIISKIIVVSVLLVFMVSCAQKQNNTLKLDKNTFAPEEDIKVTFNAQSGLDSRAWIGIIPSNIDHGKEVLNDENHISYQYLDGKISGTFTFKAPKEPGNYDFRLNAADDSKLNAAELASVSFTVK
jgi:hypothetical protein